MTNTRPNMEAFFTGAKAGLVIVCGILVTRIPLSIAAVSSTIEETKIEIKTAAAIGVFACTIVWWLARRFQRIEDRFDGVDGRLDALESKRRRLQIKDKDED